MTESEKLTIDEIIEHCNKTCKMTEMFAIQRGEKQEDITSKGYWEHYQVANYLEELQQYRAIGLTPKMVKEMIESEKLASHAAIIRGAELELYQAIGTIEEFKALKEKNTPYKPKEYEDRYYACKCGNPLLHKWDKYPTKLMPKTRGLSYCLNCGQKLDWSN